jgi:hypothetical protein
MLCLLAAMEFLMWMWNSNEMIAIAQQEPPLERTKESSPPIRSTDQQLLPTNPSCNQNEFEKVVTSPNIF